jgi:predicted MFS family arabinose efflux permease
MLGRLIAAGSVASILSYCLVWAAFRVGGLDFTATYLIGGGVTLLIAAIAAFGFPKFPEKVVQHKKLILRRRYWLYYALTFMSGARRQIFIVFAGFLLVQKFGLKVENMALLFMFTSILNIPLAPRIGRLIQRWGERPALIFEYTGLIGVFTAYAFVDHAGLAAALYVIDHLFFALAIAIRTYFQKIADPADIASTAGVAFTINHIAAVIIPVAFGLLWLASPAAVFLCGAGIAGISLLLALLMPNDPAPGNETINLGRAAAEPQ